MAEFFTDQGKVILPGYTNAFPPGDGLPTFALSADTPGVASQISQAGGSVTVDILGGIAMQTSATSFIGLDSFNNIAINTTTASGTATIEMIGQSTVTIQATDGLAILESVANDSFLSLGLDVELQSRGALLGGGDVNVTNAGTIAFDTLGAGAITGVQTINGAVYPPPAGSNGTSITQAGALVACLGSGAITISSIGVGADVEVYNAGTVRFDTMGAGAITGLSTINSVAYNPFPGSLSSISGGGASVEAISTIALQTNGDAFLTLNGAEAVVPGRITMSAGSSKPAIVLNDGGQSVQINNLYSAIPSYLTMDTNGVVEVSGAAVNIGNLSTVNGVQFVNGGTVSQDLTVSTLTAGVSLSTPALNVSSISGVAWPLPGFVIPSALFCSTLQAYDYVSTNALLGVSTMSNATALDIYTNALTITGDVSFSLTDGNGGGITGTGGDVFLTNISTISKDVGSMNITAGYSVDIKAVNVSVLDTGGAGLQVTAGTTILSAVSSISGGAGYLNMSAANTVTVESTGDELHLKGSSIRVGVDNGSTDVYLNGNTEVGGTLNVISSITGVSSISGVAWPVPGYVLPADITVSTLTAANLVSTTALNVSSIGGVAWPLSQPTQVLGKYGATVATLALTGSFVAMATQTFTTLRASAPLLVWGVFSVLDGGGGSIVQARLVINGTNGVTQTVDLPNGHNGQIICIGTGTAPVTPGTFNVVLQALVSSGTASRVSASIITNSQFVLSA